MFGSSFLGRLLCSKPDARERCVTDWSLMEDRLVRMEREGRVRAEKLDEQSKKMDTLIGGFADHIEREERAMESHIELTTMVNKRMKAILKIFAAEDVQSQFIANIDEEDFYGH